LINFKFSNSRAFQNSYIVRLKNHFYVKTAKLQRSKCVHIKLHIKRNINNSINKIKKMFLKKFNYILRIFQRKTYKYFISDNLII